MSDAPIARQTARERWNRRFADGAGALARDAPSEWLVENDDLLRARAAPGRTALDVAAGSGRNSLHLARLGFAVVALDVSDVAIGLLRDAAGKLELPVDARVVDLERVDGLGEPASYDVVVNLNYLQRDLFGALHEALAADGLLLFETFGPAHLEQLGRRVSPEFVLGPGELRRAFAGLHVHRYEEVVAERSGRPRGVASLAASRRA